MAWAGLRMGLCHSCQAGCRLATVRGPAGWCLGLRSRASCRPGAGSMCGCAVTGGCSGRVPTAPVFVGLGMALLPAGDARCPWILVAAWCCGWRRSAAPSDARSCRGLCGAPALDGAGASVVCVASAACCWCGAEVDGPEDAEAVGPCGAPTPDSARARTFVALVAAVARDQGRRLVMVVVLREEEGELWCRLLRPPSWPLPHCHMCPAVEVGRAAFGRAVPMV